MAYGNYFQQYGNMYRGQGVTPALLSNIARLESNYRPNAMNNWDSNAAAGTPSGGIMQFIHPTFNGYLREAQRANPKVYGRWSEKDWMNPEAQIAVAAHAIGPGKHGSAWATYDRARGGAATGSEPIKYGDTSSRASSSAPGMSPQEALIAQAFTEDPEIGSALASRLGARTAASGGGYGSGSVPTGSSAGFDYTEFPRLKGEPAWKWIQRIGRVKFGLRNDPGIGQTYGGKHAPGSQHYAGSAVDWGDALNTRQQLDQANRYFSNMPGISTIWQAPGHYDHLHVGAL